MKQTFKHVKDHELRSLLLGDLSEDALCHALTLTNSAANADDNAPDIPRDIAERRNEYAYQADQAWNEHGDMAAALEALRAFWSV